MLENAVLGLFCRAGAALPGLIPVLNRRLAGLMGRSEHLDASHRVYANTRLVRFTEMEYAIPRERAAEALERVLALIERRRLPIGFPIELRVTAPDDALLSTAHGRPTAYIAVHQYVGMEFETYFRAVEAIMDEYGGRPHWGKRHYQSAATLRAALPGLGALRGDPRPLRPRAQVRERLPEAGAGMSATLYGIPGSHAVRTGELMLEHKGIEFRRVNFPPGPHRVLVRLNGFSGDRVPAVKFEDGRRAQGTRELPRVLDELAARAAPRVRRSACARGRALGRRRAPAVGAAHGGLHRLAQSRRAGRAAARAAGSGRFSPRTSARGAWWRAWCWWRSGSRRSSSATTASARARSSIAWTPGSRRAC